MRKVQCLGVLQTLGVLGGDCRGRFRVSGMAGGSCREQFLMLGMGGGSRRMVFLSFLGGAVLYRPVSRRGTPMAARLGLACGHSRKLAPNFFSHR